MKIAPINTFLFSNKIHNKKNNIQNPIVQKNIAQDSFVKTTQVANNVPTGHLKTIPFLGYKIHIVDLGRHADEMAHFAKLDAKGVDKVVLHRGEYSANADFNKPLKNIETQLKEINSYGLTDKESYVAIPVKITVPLQNLAEQYKRVMGHYLHLKPHSTQTCKKSILTFLKELYENPEKHKKYIRYMDPNNQGIEYSYGIIQEINKLNCKKAYVPADYPHKETIEWLAGTKGETPELNNYLATGYDKDGKVNNMLNYIKGKEWYDFNLLALSKADVVNLKKADGYSDHIHSSYDTTVNDGSRGVYNLSPVRENGKIVGYSYKDMVTNQYPVSDFPYNLDVAEVAKFVGRHVDEVVADDRMTHEFRMAMEEGRDTSEFSGKLYPVWKVFGDEQLRSEKIFDKGDFVDSDLKNYYRRNAHYEIIYPKADCENNGRPSVRAMWGSEYSMLNAMKRDISEQDFADNMVKEFGINFSSIAADTYKSAKDAFFVNDYIKSERLLNEAIESINLAGFDLKKEHHIESYNLMGDVKTKLGDYDGASWYYNKAINSLSKNVMENYGVDSKIYHTTMKDRVKIHDIFVKLADIAKIRGEGYPEQECLRAAGEVRGLTTLGAKVLERRADNDINIGDIFA